MVKILRPTSSGAEFSGKAPLVVMFSGKAQMTAVLGRRPVLRQWLMPKRPLPG